MLTLKPYRRAAVPLLAVQTADPAEVLRLAITEANNGTACPVLVWDCIHGLTAANTESAQITAVINNNQDPAIATSNPIEALRAIEQLGRMDEGSNKAIVVLFGMADVLADPQAGIPARQALWNLRDILPQRGILCVLCVPLGWRNPFPNDVAVAVNALPERSDLIGTVTKLCSEAKLDAPDDQVLTGAGDALLGLSAFAAEQAVALSLTKSGLDVKALWARKRQQISETPGLSVYDGPERFADLGGLEQAKALFGLIMAGRRKPGAIVFIDEIEKALAGSAGDTSGVSQSMLGYLLSYMEDQAATGAIFVGPPGAAKSALAKAVGNEGNIPTVCFDLSGVKGSLVGESEARMRAALQVITAISGGRPIFLATCNSISVLPPELRRRFTIGTMFFDLPTKAEQAAIWPIYTAKYGLPEQPLPTCDGWTGAEIKQCADLADRLGVSLIEAARYIVPVSVSAREKIQTLRQEASGRYLSASQPGVYLYNPSGQITGRAIDVKGV